MTDHIETLRAFNAWRRGHGDSIQYDAAGGAAQIGIAIDAAIAEIERLRNEIVHERNKNDFDAKRLRRVSMLLGLSVPESDEALLCCAGTILGMSASAIEEIFNSQAVAK